MKRVLIILLICMVMFAATDVHAGLRKSKRDKSRSSKADSSKVENTNRRSMKCFYKTYSRSLDRHSHKNAMGYMYTEEEIEKLKSLLNNILNIIKNETDYILSKKRVAIRILRPRVVGVPVDDFYVSSFHSKKRLGEIQDAWKEYREYSDKLNTKYNLKKNRDITEDLKF